MPRQGPPRRPRPPRRLGARTRAAHPVSPSPSEHATSARERSGPGGASFARARAALWPVCHLPRPCGGGTAASRRPPATPGSGSKRADASSSSAAAAAARRGRPPPARPRSISAARRASGVVVAAARCRARSSASAAVAGKALVRGSTTCRGHRPVGRRRRAADARTGFCSSSSCRTPAAKAGSSPPASTAAPTAAIVGWPIAATVPSARLVSVGRVRRRSCSTAKMPSGSGRSPVKRPFAACRRAALASSSASSGLPPGQLGTRRASAGRGTG